MSTALVATVLAPRYAALLERCQPYVITARTNLAHLELEPLGIPIPPQRRYDPTHSGSREIIDLLHTLDERSFGDQGMLMPRWVMFDCGEFPGVVVGLGCPATDLDDELRHFYRLEAHPDLAKVWVPLSMWIAIPCAEPRTWFGHNLSSANFLSTRRSRPGLGTLTKVMGVAVTGARFQIGATQWDSSALGLHVSLGRPELVSAWTPAHTHPATVVYRLQVDRGSLAARLGPEGLRLPESEGPSRTIVAGDEAAMRALHAEIEAGARFAIERVETGESGESGSPQRVHLVELRRS